MFYLPNSVQSFFSKRQISVAANGFSSTNYLINAGIIQGYILAPTPFHVDSNDKNYDRSQLVDGVSRTQFSIIFNSGISPANLMLGQKQLHNIFNKNRRHDHFLCGTEVAHTSKEYIGGKI